MVFASPLSPEQKHVDSLAELRHAPVDALSLAFLKHVFDALERLLDSDVRPDCVLLPDAVVAQEPQVRQA
eukprot:3939919-Rhodomonas_salina.2